MIDPIVTLSEQLIKELNRDGHTHYMSDAEKELHKLIKTYAPSLATRVADLENEVEKLKKRIDALGVIKL